MTPVAMATTTEPRERILVIDDTASVRAALVEILERHGYDAVPAPDGLSALRVLEGSGFDLIVTDVVMPHVGGLQLLELVRRLDPDVPVLVVTGYATRDVALEALGQGAAGFLEKPFRVDGLLAAVRSALARSHLRQYSREMAAAVAGTDLATD